MKDWLPMGLICKWSLMSFVTSTVFYEARTQQLQCPLWKLIQFCTEVILFLFVIASVIFDYCCRLHGKLSLCTIIFLNRSIKWFVYISDWYRNFWHYEVINLIWTGPQMGCYLSLECIKLCAIMFLNRSVKLHKHQCFISKLLTLWGAKFHMKFDTLVGLIVTWAYNKHVSCGLS